jgi:hypothetical protein
MKTTIRHGDVQIINGEKHTIVLAGENLESVQYWGQVMEVYG